MWTLILIFVALFLAVTLLAFALAAPSTKETKRTISRLQAIAPRAGSLDVEEAVDLRRSSQLSNLPWLDRLLRRIDLSERLRLLLYQADLKWTVGQLVLMATLLAVVAGSLAQLRTGALPFAFIVGTAAGLAPFGFVFRKRSYRFGRMQQYLPEALDLMNAAIRAGHSLSSAMSMAAKESPDPIRQEFRQCYEEQNFGMELRIALTNLAYRVPIHSIRIVVAAMLIQNDSGGNLTEILERVAHLIREDYRLQGQIRVHTAQGRMTGWILSLLPAVLGILLYLVHPDQMSVLWTREAGRIMLYGSLVMTTIGALLIRKIVRIEV